MPAPPALLAALAYGWWAAGLAPFSSRATVAVVGAGVTAAVVGRLALPPRPAVEPATGAAGRPWLVAVVALAAWQLAAWSQGPRDDHPTLSSLANAALDARPVRAVALAAWLAGAAWLGRR